MKNGTQSDVALYAIIKKEKSDLQLKVEDSDKKLIHI